MLKPYIRCYRIIESEDAVINRILPAASAAMAFRIKGQVSFIEKEQYTALPSTVLSGLRRSARQMLYAPGTATIIVQFTATGIAAFLQQPNELFGQSISLEDIYNPPMIAETEERLMTCGNNKERIDTIEAFLLSIMKPLSSDPLVQEAITLMHAAKGDLRMRDLSKRLYISQDAFEKRFRKVTGATPKQFAHILKMNTVIRQSAASASLPDLAFDNGYYDLPHFNKHFKRFTGLTPTEFFASGRYW